MKETTKTYVAPKGATASNPGKMPINYFQWFMSYPKWPVGITLTLAVFSALALTGSWLWWIPVVPVLALGIFLMLRCHDIFVIGDVNPGLVIQESPLLIAVSTDMGRFGGNIFPVVAVVPANVPSAYRHKGARVPMVCTYGALNDKPAPHWNGFFPEAIPAGITDAETIQAKINSIPGKSWTSLQQQIGQLKQPYAEGVYRIQTETSKWEQYPDGELFC